FFGRDRLGRLSIFLPLCFKFPVSPCRSASPSVEESSASFSSRSRFGKSAQRLTGANDFQQTAHSFGPVKVFSWRELLWLVSSYGDREVRLSISNFNMTKTRSRQVWVSTLVAAAA